MRIPIVCIIGPTASGKTALSVELALQLGGEVISADSMQVYRHMDIATAKPGVKEQRGVPHHLLDFLEPTEEFSVARFCELARPIIDDIHARGKLPILCGGTGLYIDSLLGNMQFSDIEVDPRLRGELTAMLNEKGIDYMLDLIRTFDPDSAERLCIERNPKRIIRCLEIYRSSGMTQTELNLRQISAPSPYLPVKIGLAASDRSCLYERVNRRVDLMLEQGLLDEAAAFYRGVYGTTASAAIGYKELLPYLCGELPLDICVENLKRSTRRYVKRQLTWFSRDESVHWLLIDKLSFDDITAQAVDIIKRKVKHE